MTGIWRLKSGKKSEERKAESILYMPLKEFVPAVMPYAKFYIDGENEE